MTFKTENSNLLYNDKIIFAAPAFVEIEEIFDDKVLIFYKGTGIVHILENLEDINRNILMVDKEGTIVWRISNNSEKYCSYPSLYNEKGQWKAYRFDGYEYDLDLETGKISNPEYVR